MKKINFVLLFSLISLSANIAQKLHYAQGQLMVKPRAGVDIQRWANQWAVFEGRKTNFQVQKRVSEPLNVWVITFDYTRISELRLLEAIRKDKAIEVAQLNHLLELRSTLPNDPQIGQQWQYFNTGQSGGLPGADLGMHLAWDITTGGLSATGDTIVVCVIDDGLNRDHPDFAGNIWVNHAEIPNNGIDDDGNGFVDDYLGWNTARDNDAIYDRANHGTPVAAIIGARGNNGIGVSGVNWNVKLMIVKGGIGLESEAIEAYSYPLVMRKRYNATNGQQGAFVVATNSSWGANYLFPEDAPLWCAMYDSLGVHGILNAGATANLNVNVDVVGDLPTTCPSDYLIAVTNLNDRNMLVQDAGYGEVNIDLAAYGDGTWTVDPPTGYGTFGGTSAATPHVAGAIALLYSAPCPGFARLYKSDPKAAALLVRQFILDGTIFTPATQYLTATQGRLNVNNSLRLLMNACSDCFPPTSLDADNITDKQARLTWSANADIRRVDLRWRRTGTATWTEVPNAASPLTLNNLLACTEYEFQLKAFCANDTLNYTNSFRFRTDGCCEPPTGFRAGFIGTSIGNFQWSPVLAAASYTLQLRPAGSSESWRTLTSFGTSLLVNNLQACTNYEARLNAICNGEPSEFGESYFFRTPGCSACLERDYCIPRNLSTAEEWIESIKVHTLQNTSGDDGGYANFTGMTPPELMQGNRYAIELQPGFRQGTHLEYFSVWIDFNQDGIFDNTERVYEKGLTTQLFKDSISIPENATPGGTRMRIAIQFRVPGGPCTYNTGPDGGGEVEDYCVQIIDRTTAAPAPLTPQPALRLYPNPFTEQLQVALELPHAQPQVALHLYNATGQRVHTSIFEDLTSGAHTRTLSLAQLPPGVYWLQCRWTDGSTQTQKIVKTRW